MELDSGRCRILVVENEEDVRDLIVDVLSPEFDCFECWRGKEALAAARSQPYHLMLLDLGLDDMDGLTVLRELRQWVPARALPVFVLTGSAAVDLPSTCLNAFADDFLEKPFQASELLARVKAILRRTLVMSDLRVEVGLGLVLDHKKRVAEIYGRPTQPLCDRQMEFLAELARAGERGLSRAEAAKLLLVNDAVAQAGLALNEAVHKLRARMPRDFEQVVWTLPKSGYVFRPTLKRTALR